MVWREYKSGYMHTVNIYQTWYLLVSILLLFWGTIFIGPKKEIFLYIFIYTSLGNLAVYDDAVVRGKWPCSSVCGKLKALEEFFPPC